MENWKRLSSTTAILLATSSVAQADVSAADVWQAWQDASAAVGQTLTAGSEEANGGVLTITDLAIAMQTTDTELNSVIPNVTFTENGDGTVSVAMAPSYDMTVTVRPEGTNEVVDITVTVTSDTLAMQASGDPGAVNYNFNAGEMTISASEVVADGEVIPLNAIATLAGVTGNYATTTGDDPSVVSTFNSETLTINFDMNEPGGEGFFKANLVYDALAIESEGALMMLSGGVTELPAALQAGANTSTTMTHGPATFMVDFQDGRDAFALNGTAATGLLGVALSAEALSYEVNNTGLDMTISGSEIPLPEVQFSMGELGFGLLTPVSKSDVPQDFGFNFTLADLAISDMLWSMVDAGGVLPHDPATMIIDVTGKANFLFDLFNPDSMIEVEADVPAEIHELSVNALQLKAIGGDLTGNGAFTFDNSNLETFDGLPAPTGKLNLQLVGANAVIDNLIAAGLLPQEQAMGARMMLGLFARPGDGEDTLVSEIEIDGASGAISANGQRIQ